MTVHFRKSFVKDLDLLDSSHRIRVEKAIQESKAALSLHDVQHLKKLQGSRNFFRIRVGEYRLGLASVSDELIFVRCLRRKEFYRYFP
jgi:mRNA interferase RelE/StbE